MGRYTDEAFRRTAMMRIDQLERQTAKLPSRIKGGGGGGFNIRPVSSLPAIPDSGHDVVFWTGGDPPQIWWVFAGQTGWTPGQFTTSESGTP